MRALVLGHALDPTVQAVTLALRQRHPRTDVQRATLPELQRARWTHCIAADGAVVTTIDPGDGRNLADADVVFNRLEAASALSFTGWSDADCAYGRIEWTALLLAWLTSYGVRAINRPQFGTIAGPSDRAWTWLARAAASGLPPHRAGATTSTRRFPPPRDGLPHPALLPVDATAGVATSLPALVRRTGYAAPADRMMDVTVVGDEVFGNADAAQDTVEAVRHACCRLAAYAGTPVLGVRLAHEDNGDETDDAPGGWRFVAANPSPVIDGGAALHALVSLLERRAAGGS